jgi:hypothetical protein
VVTATPQPVTSSVPPVVALAPVAQTAPVRNINGKAALAARMQGKTGGFSRHGHQLTFASSAPSKSSSAASATGDLWAGVQASTAAPSIASAAASGAQSTGVSSAVVAGLVIFGLGLIGLAGGGAYLVVTSRRRAGASKRG